MTAIMVSSTSIVLAVLGLVAASQAQQTIQMESKIDGKVLTVTDQFVPPLGVNSRYGVAPRIRDDSLAQKWDFRNWTLPTQGSFYSHGALGFDEITTGLICGNCFPYTFEYDVGEVTPDDYRLLRQLDVMSDNTKCIQNTGNEGDFIGFVECNMQDPSQLWIFRQV